MSLSAGMLQVVAAAFDASSEMVAVFEAANNAAGGLRFVDASGAFLRFANMPMAQLVGHPLGMIVAPEALSGLQRIEAAVRSHVAARGDLLFADPNGKRAWISYHLMPAPSTRSESDIRNFVLIGTDTTEGRAEAEQARLIQSLLAKSFMLADAPLAIVKPDGHFLLTNRYFDRLSGHADGSFAGKASFDSVVPSCRPSLQAARDRQAADGLPYTVDSAMLAGDGSSIAVQITSTLVEAADRQRFRVITLHPLAAPTVIEERRREEPGTIGRAPFISLEEIRLAMGDRWAGVAERVLAIAEGMIRRRLEEGDRLSMHGERGFTIRFAHADETQSRLRAASIARDISQHLMGRGGTSPAAVVVVQPPEPLPKLPGSNPKQTLPAASGKAVSAKHAVPAPDVMHPQVTENRSPRLLPIHLASSGAQVGLHVRAARSVAPGGGVFHEATFEQDLAALKRVCEMPSERSAQLVCLDVGLETFLSRRKTDTYLEVCAGIGALARPNIILMLSPLPIGITVSLLQDVARRVKPFCGGLGCHLIDVAPPKIDLRAIPLGIVALDMADFHLSDVMVVDRMRRLTALLQIHHTRLMALNLPGLGARQSLHDAGAAYVTSGEGRE